MRQKARPLSDRCRKEGQSQHWPHEQHRRQRSRPTMGGRDEAAFAFCADCCCSTRRAYSPEGCSSTQRANSGHPSTGATIALDGGHTRSTRAGGRRSKSSCYCACESLHVEGPTAVVCRGSPLPRATVSFYTLKITRNHIRDVYERSCERQRIPGDISDNGRKMHDGSILAP